MTNAFFLNKVNQLLPVKHSSQGERQRDKCERQGVWISSDGTHQTSRYRWETLPERAADKLYVSLWEETEQLDLAR